MKKVGLLCKLGNSLIISIFVLFVTLNSWAADAVSPTWRVPSVDNQVRNLTEDYSGPNPVVGAGSAYGNASNSTLSIDGLTVSTEGDIDAAYTNGTAYVVGGAVYNKEASGNRAIIKNSSTIQGRTVFGGAAFLDSPDNRLGTGSASNNTVSIKDSAITYSSAIPTGATKKLGGDVIGGYANYSNGHADSNYVLLDNSAVEGNVYGGKVEALLIPDVDYDLETGELRDHVTINYTADNNRVEITNGSVVAGTVYASAGAEGAHGNEIIVDNSNVLGSVYGAYNAMSYYNASSAEAVTSFEDNTIAVRNNATVAGALAVGGFSANAYNNALLIDNAHVSSGSLHTVMMSLGLDDNNPINATIRGNVLYLSNMALPLTLDEIGAGLNYAGTANQHTTYLNNVSNLTVSRSSLFGLGTYIGSDWDTLKSSTLIGLKDMTATAVNTDNLNTSYGVIYGGAALDYVRQFGDLGGNGDNYTVPTADAEGKLPSWATTTPTEEILANGPQNESSASGNLVQITNSTVNSNIIGGFAGELKEIYYTTWAYTPATPGSGSEPPTPAKYTKTVVRKMGDTTTTTVYDCGTDGTSCDSGTVSGDPSKEEDYKDKVFSANNNTVLIENSTVKGTVYGGFVAGADLRADHAETSNNTVILRGNAVLDPSAVLYGGNAYLGQTTNTLVFDYINDGAGGYVTYNNKNQFKNFNNTWQINADYNTRINFDFEGVNALVNLDPSVSGENVAQIIKTKTATDLSNVEENGVVKDLIDTSVELSRGRIGIYSYDLTPTKGSAPNTVNWTLSGKKDSSNVEIYGQLPLVGLALAAEGPEMLARTYVEAWQSDAESNVFLNGGVHKTRYETGSGFDLRAGIAQVGLWKKFTSNWMGGFFVKYAGGSYKTYPIKATGEADTYGGGLMTSLYLTETTRLEGEVEVGYMKLEFESDELLSKLKSKGKYYGAMGGIVQDLTENWDIFANLHFLRKDSDKMTDSLGQQITYDGMETFSWKVGTDYALNQQWGNLTPSFGAMAIYEMAGKSKVNVQDASNKEASLKGLSGRGQFNLSYENQSTFLPMVSQLTLFGQVGKRRGFGGEVNISFLF